MKQSNEPRIMRSPLKGAGLLLGIGLAALLDVILLRSLLQLHAMVSSRIPLAGEVALAQNRFWDGVFLLGAWLVTVLGVFALWRAGKRPDVPWRKNALLGSGFVGAGLYLLAEGLLCHQVLELHHVIESATGGMEALWDLLFLFAGVALIGLGSWLIGSDDRAANGEMGTVTQIRRSKAI